jgi:PAS domain S-box-containing protein
LCEVKERYINYRKENEILKKRVSEINRTFDELSHIIYIKDSKLKYKSINNAFLQIAGLNFNEREVIGSSASDIFGFKEIKEVLEFEQHVLKYHEKIINKKIIIPKSNGKRTGLLSITPVFSEKNEIMELLCTINDITVLSEAIEKQELLKKIINNIEDVVWIKAFNPVRYIFISNGCEKLFGIPHHELMSNPNSILKVIHPDDIIGKCSYEDGRLYFKPGVYKARYIKTDGSIQVIESKIYETINKTGNKILYGINRCIDP